MKEKIKNMDGRGLVEALEKDFILATRKNPYKSKNVDSLGETVGVSKQGTSDPSDKHRKASTPRVRPTETIIIVG